MSRNIIIVTIILVLAIVAGYLVWLRSKLVPQFTAPVQKVEDIQGSSPLPQATSQVLPTPAPASPSATPSKTASPSAKPKK